LTWYGYGCIIKHEMSCCVFAMQDTCGLENILGRPQLVKFWTVTQ
jgi:hypothetical protein